MFDYVSIKVIVVMEFVGDVVLNMFGVICVRFCNCVEYDGRVV